MPGLPDTRIRHAAEITALRCPAHHKRMITAAWNLGPRDAAGDLRLRRWAHMLGSGGHFLTKSRPYSVTFATSSPAPSKSVTSPGRRSSSAIPSTAISHEFR